MNLDFKKAFRDIFGLKYFWVYILIFAAFTALSSIIQSVDSMPYHNAISNFVSIFTYIASGYLFIMIHNLINGKELNEYSFKQSLCESTKKGLKAFVGTLTNTLIAFIAGSLVAIVSTLIFIKITGNVITESNLFSFPILNFAFATIVFILSIFMMFILKLLPVAYSKEFSLKEMFCWRKVFKSFFQKGKTKDTILILALYVLILITSLIVFWAITFFVNLTMIYLTKIMILNHYLAFLLLTHFLNVIGPFLIGMLQFFVQGLIYHLLAQVYGRQFELEV